MSALTLITLALAGLALVGDCWSHAKAAATGKTHEANPVRDAVTAAADANIILVEGTTLATGDVSHFPDSVHPNDTASAQIATALAAVVSP